MKEYPINRIFKFLYIFIYIFAIYKKIKLKINIRICTKFEESLNNI